MAGATTTRAVRQGCSTARRGQEIITTRTTKSLACYSTRTPLSAPEGTIGSRHACPPFARRRLTDMSCGMACRARGLKATAKRMTRLP